MSSKGATLLELKMRAKAREDEDKAKAARKRNMLVLVLDYLCKNGYTDSLDRLQSESSISLSKWQAADNVDLTAIFQEFESFYELKYGRPPRLVRPATNEDAEEMEKAAKTRRKAAVALPNLPSGMGSTPSALPAHYRSSYSAVDGYQGNGMDNATGMTHSGGGSIEQQSVGGGGGAGKHGPGSAPASSSSSSSGAAAASSPPAGSPPRDLPRAKSAKGSKADKIAAAIAAGAAASAADAAAASANSAHMSMSQTGRLPSKSDSKSRGHKPAASVEFSVQGSASSSLNLPPNAVPATAASPSAASSSASSSSSSSISIKTGKNRPLPSARSETPDSDGGVSGTGSSGTDHSSYYETRFGTQRDAAGLHSTCLHGRSNSYRFDFLTNVCACGRILKPMPEYADSQFRELAHIITRDIYSENPNVHWSDIAELEEAKQLLQEAVVMPLRFPQFFTGLLSPWKGVLLYGPPGTGKTMLARAVATECQTTFFNISASSIVSKFRGDSEKLVRVLFELARYHAPSTIFIDEIDSIMGRRDAAGEHEGSRRMKTELLIQMDGLSKSDDLVFVLAASNLPWDLDIALLRRLEKRILVPLPNERARYTMLKGHLGEGEGGRASGLDYADLARKTEGYSGSDIALLCKEAAMRPVRRLMKLLLTVSDHPSPQDISSEVKLDLVVEADVKQALACTRPSAQSKFLEKYTEWHAEYGAGIHDVTMDASTEAAASK